MNMNISVDIGRLLTDVGSALYKNGGTILDELVQNAQRAGASTLQVSLVRGMFVGTVSVLEVQDDGKGLDDAQSLLKLASSGWDKSVKERDQPFGMGFWSTVTATSRVEVRSNYLEIHIDVDKLHATKNVKNVVKVEQRDEWFSGFRVRLFGVPRPASESEVVNPRWEAWTSLVNATHAIGALVRFTEFERVEYREARDYGEHIGKVQAEGLLERLLRGKPEVFASNYPLQEPPPGVFFARRVKTRYFDGVLWPQAKSWDTSDGAPLRGLHYYAQRREVTSNDYEHAAGWLHLTPNAVGLRAPDRKGFVDDSRKEKLDAAYTKEARKLFLDLAVVATDAELDRFDDALRHTLKDEDVLDLEGYLFGEHMSAPQQPHREELVGGELAPILPRAVSNPEVSWSHNVQTQGTVAVRPTLPPVKRKKGKVPSPAVWVEATEEASYTEILDGARASGLPVVVARTGMQRRILQLKAEKDLGLVHARDLGGKIKVEAKVREAKAGIRDGKILLPALEDLARCVGAEVIRVGHLAFRKVLIVDGKRIPLPVDAGAILLGMNADDVIYIDATYALGIVREAKKQKNPSRYVFFRLLSTVAHERAHQLTSASDGTPEHLAMIETVMHSAHDWIAENT